MTVRLAWVVLVLSACFTPVSEPCRSKLRCPPDSGIEVCSVGSTRDCGTSVGVCMPGRQTCGPDGMWGPCTGGVQPTAEVCDGKDNNCDGTVDEGVAKLCPLQKGVCAGAMGGCGADAGCAFAYGPGYEPVETRCDGLDNDCDGIVDKSALINVSQSKGVVSRKPAAVRVPGTEAVMVLYEEGAKIVARVLRANGTLSDAVPPSVTVEASTKSYAPAIAASGSLIVAAWAEEVGATKRVMVASLDPATGRSNLAGAGALLALVVMNPSEVAVAVDEEAGRLVLAAVDNGSVNVTGFSSTLPPPMGSPAFTRVPYNPNCRRPMLSSAGGGYFWLGYEAVDGRLNRDYVAPTGPLATEPMQPLGQSSQLFGRDAGADSWFLGGTTGATRVMHCLCTAPASTVTCTPPEPLSEIADLGAFRVSDGRLAAWQQDVSSPSVTAAWLDHLDAGIRLGPGRRPSPVATSAQAVVFFDTESVVSTLVDSDEVYVQKTCR